ncbi:Domain of unknown function DUF1741 [Lasallia pustulata]|uniref:Armadillo-like helical domain-containing protein n=1 Tax=Lasallia pustulata TaxID=136370 RepID=A0A1W5CRC9_9LECA|nr:Domain of unknown function DUF1741 [Lasallia pustulata]
MQFSVELTKQTLTVFLGGVLAKRYTNPSADIIAVLAGLNEVDTVFTDFANAIESTIRAGRSREISSPLSPPVTADPPSVAVRQKAIGVAIALTSGAYQTSLVSYFTHRDLFPSLMKYVQESDSPTQASYSFLLLGLLANYNKFEFRNPYRLRLEDFVNEATIQKILRGLAYTCSHARDEYLVGQDDVPEGWNLTSTLTYIGLGALALKKTAAPISNLDDAKEVFAALPGSETAILVATYDFVNANKLFCFNFITLPGELRDQESPFSAFLSFTSYLLHHAYRSPRATLYGILNLVILRILVEDQVLCKSVCSEENKISVRLCRQRPPFLPLIAGERPVAAFMLDIVVDAINHNLRRRLDIDLYMSCIHVIQRLLVYSIHTQTRLPYHWSLLWQTLHSLLRFLTTYASDLITQNSSINLLITPLINTITLAVSSGDAFLPNSASYDDLVYKLVESGDFLTRFKSAYKAQLQTYGGNSATTPIDALINVSTHYHNLLEAEKGKGRMGKNMSPREVNKIIRQGYETLAIPLVEGLDNLEIFREGEERGMLKKVTRMAVEDARRLL